MVRIFGHYTNKELDKHFREIKIAFDETVRKIEEAHIVWNDPENIPSVGNNREIKQREITMALEKLSNILLTTGRRLKP